MTSSPVGHHQQDETDDVVSVSENKIVTHPQHIYNSRSSPPVSSPLLESPPQEPKRSAVQEKQLEKKIWANFNAFRKTVLEEWLDTENQILLCFHGISNIQYRIPMETQLLDALHNQQQVDLPWMHFGFTNTSLSSRFSSYPSHTYMSDISSIPIQKQDVEKTLAYDCVQHEKLLSNLRSLLSSLATCQNELGRILDDAYRHQEQAHFLTFHPDTVEPNSSVYSTSLLLYNTMNQVYRILSQELYKKQYYSCDSFSLSEDSTSDLNTFSDPTKRWSHKDSYYRSNRVIPMDKISMDTIKIKQLLERHTVHTNIHGSAPVLINYMFLDQGL